LAERKLDDLPNTQAGAAGGDHRLAHPAWPSSLIGRGSISPWISSRPGAARSPRRPLAVERHRSALAATRRRPSRVVGVQAIDAARLAAALHH
jgi:hypothetical protein